MSVCYTLLCAVMRANIAIPEISAVLAQLIKYSTAVAVILAFFLLLWTAQVYYRLAHIPGPFLARFTNLSRLSWVLSYKAHDIHILQHRKYGPLVRFGPNMVSVACPSEVGTIYGFSKPWLKVRNSCFSKTICI